MRSKLAVLFASMVVLGLASFAYAKSIEDTLGGQIILTTKALPSQFKTADSLRKLSETKFSYEKLKENEMLIINYIVVLKKAITSSGEVTILDVTDSQKGKVVMTTPFYTSERDQRIYASTFEIDEKTLPGNRKYRIVFSYRNSIMAKGDFYVKAKPQKFDGKVEFTDEETKGN
jgi:hypothetical protein